VSFSLHPYKINLAVTFKFSFHLVSLIVFLIFGTPALARLHSKERRRGIVIVIATFSLPSANFNLDQNVLSSWCIVFIQATTTLETRPLSRPD
jgi:hypothetical protein